MLKAMRLPSKASPLAAVTAHALPLQQHNADTPTVLAPTLMMKVKLMTRHNPHLRIRPTLIPHLQPPRLQGCQATLGPQVGHQVAATTVVVMTPLAAMAMRTTMPEERGCSSN